MDKFDCGGLEKERAFSIATAEALRSPVAPSGPFSCYGWGLIAGGAVRSLWAITGRFSGGGTTVPGRAMILRPCPASRLLPSGLP